MPCELLSGNYRSKSLPDDFVDSLLENLRRKNLLPRFRNDRSSRFLVGYSTSNFAGSAHSSPSHGQSPPSHALNPLRDKGLSEVLYLPKGPTM